MNDDRQPTRLGRFLFWAGIGFTATSVITDVLVHRYSPRLFGASITQLCLVLGFVRGSTLAIVGLHSSGKIGKDALDRTTVALAVAAIVFAFWQFEDAKLVITVQQLL